MGIEIFRRWKKKEWKGKDWKDGRGKDGGKKLHPIFHPSIPFFRVALEHKL
jgi:hypothetical protein